MKSQLSLYRTVIDPKGPKADVVFSFLFVFVFSILVSLSDFPALFVSFVF